MKSRMVDRQEADDNQRRQVCEGGFKPENGCETGHTRFTRAHTTSHGLIRPHTSPHDRLYGHIFRQNRVRFLQRLKIFYDLHDHTRSYTSDTRPSKQKNSGQYPPRTGGYPLIPPKFTCYGLPSSRHVHNLMVMDHFCTNNHQNTALFPVMGSLLNRD